MEYILLLKQNYDDCEFGYEDLDVNDDDADCWCD